MLKWLDFLHVCIGILGTSTDCQVGTFESAVLVLVLVWKFVSVEVPVCPCLLIAAGDKQVAIDAGVGALVVSLQGSASFLEKSIPNVVRV